MIWITLYSNLSTLKLKVENVRLVHERVLDFQEVLFSWLLDLFAKFLQMLLFLKLIWNEVFVGH